MMVLWLTHYLCAYTDEQEFQKEKEGKKYLQNIDKWNSGVQFGLTSYSWFHNQIGMHHKLIWVHKYDFRPKF